MAFRGMRVFISRKDFPPHFIDSVRDMLSENGAEICICSNPSCNASTDFHILSSSQHEKVVEYRSQGCNVIGPDCFVRCAKEHRPFPKQGYTCCLAMEGVKVLATGFEKVEKLEIERLVTAMCGELETKALTNVSFIIAKDVLAAKYKFSMNNLRRPILKIDWLFQCWREHRLVPHEPYRLPPFAGLTICATNVPLEERKEIEEVCVKNGGVYSADLTKKCTHLIAYLPQGDKFKVARRWGTVKIVNRQWLGQCLAAKACLDEDLFSVNAGKEKASTISQVSGPPPLASPPENSKSEIVMSSAASMVSNTVSCDQMQLIDNADDSSRMEPSLQDDEQSILLKRSLEDSFCEEENMYLSNCRIYFTGFAVSDLRKYVNMVRDGGGTRHIEFNDRVTHVVIGKPTDSELKEIRQSTCMKSIQVLWPSWLEECNQQRKEVLITQKHLIPDGLLVKGSSSQDTPRMENMLQQSSRKQQLSSSQSLEFEFDQNDTLSKGNVGDVKNAALRENKCISGGTLSDESHLLHDIDKPQHASKQLHAGEVKAPGSTWSSLVGQKSHDGNLVLEQLGVVTSPNTKGMAHFSNGSSKDGIFKGYVFAICESFPMERREEIVQWVVEGGGLMEREGVSYKNVKRRIDFLVVSHGTKVTSVMMMMHAKPISSHWIRFCLEEKELLSLESHVLYQPLQCQVPLPGFQALRFCVSQYEDKDRLLLRNLCFVLGAKFTEKLNKKVTHLLCKVRDGQKYDAACKWGMQITTAEWLFACISEDKILPLLNFQPRELSAAEKDAGFLGMTQCPSQAAHLASGEMGSQWAAETETFRPTQFPEAKNVSTGPTRTSPMLVDASMAHLSERNKYVLSMHTLSSQDAAPSLDPWDEQTVQWSGCDDTKHKNVYPEGTVPTEKMKRDHSNAKAGSNSHCITTTSYVGGSLKIRYPIANESGDAPEMEQQMVVSSDKENHNSSDVAAAIEGILAQTSKVKCDDALRNMGIDQEISPEHTTLKRMREEPHFKRPKLQTMSSGEKAEKPKAFRSPARDSSVFDESQMESQVIGYDEDHSGKQLIMERVRTRSMSTTDVSKPARKVAAWRNDGLGRLFRVAEANK